ncbi:MAG: hypothetical protein L0216_02940 [Planctomycetales bacterium]|nr:hypothetical protein [Planctomycetales bacterium]
MRPLAAALAIAVAGLVLGFLAATSLVPGGPRPTDLVPETTAATTTAPAGAPIPALAAPRGAAVADPGLAPLLAEIRDELRGIRAALETGRPGPATPASASTPTPGADSAVADRRVGERVPAGVESEIQRAELARLGQEVSRFRGHLHNDLESWRGKLRDASTVKARQVGEEEIRLIERALAELDEVRSISALVQWRTRHDASGVDLPWYEWSK